MLPTMSGGASASGNLVAVQFSVSPTRQLHISGIYLSCSRGQPGAAVELLAIPPYQVSGPVFEVPTHDGDQEVRIGLIRLQHVDLLAMVSSANGFGSLSDHRTAFMLVGTGEVFESASEPGPGRAQRGTGAHAVVAAAQDLGLRMEHLGKSIASIVSATQGGESTPVASSLKRGSHSAPPSSEALTPGSGARSNQFSPGHSGQRALSDAGSSSSGTSDAESSPLGRSSWPIRDLVNRWLRGRLRRQRCRSSSGLGTSRDPKIGALGTSRTRNRRPNRKHPFHIKKPHIKRKKGKLVETEETKAYLFIDCSLRLRRDFGEMAGKWRIHRDRSEILEVSLPRETTITSAMLIQVQKCIHRAVSDEGAWGRVKPNQRSESPPGPVPSSGVACEEPLRRKEREKVNE